MRATKISKTYRRGLATTFRVQNVTLSVEKGEVTALVGPNGSGKTTVVKILLGLARAESGSVTCDARGEIGLLREGASNLFELLTVQENLAYFSCMAGEQVTADRKLWLTKAFRLEPLMPKVVAQLSRGQRQHVSLTIALMLAQSYCVLDEPTVGLDIHMLSILKDALRQIAADNVGILVVSHDMNFIESVCDKSYVISEGRIVDYVDVAEQSDSPIQEFSVSRRVRGSGIGGSGSNGTHVVTSCITADSPANLLQELDSLRLSDIITIRNDRLSILSRYERQVSGAPGDAPN